MLHREDGPASEYSDGTKEWWVKDQLHREDGPASEYSDGTKQWWVKDQLHREDGPASEYSDGTKEWLVKDQLHREDGPASEYSDGTKEWWQNNLRHRVDGPAYIGSGGEKFWWLNGVAVTEQIVMQPNTIMLAQIQNSSNNEVRAIMIERYGWARYLADSKAKMFDKRNNAVQNTKEALFATRSFGNRLVVSCPTGRIFILGVPNDITTCKEAQKWLGNASNEINVIGWN